MRPRNRRLAIILVVLAFLAGAAALVLSALDRSVTFFYSPSDIATTAIDPDLRMRVGGLVVPGSIREDADGALRFDITDNAATLNVRYAGIVPDLFREGQGIVALGRIRTAGVFEAEEVLAKHDETYMPPEVAKTLKDKGHWKPESTAP